MDFFSRTIIRLGFKRAWAVIVFLGLAVSVILTNGIFYIVTGAWAGPLGNVAAFSAPLVIGIPLVYVVLKLAFRLHSAEEKMRHLALHDDLTLAGNRRYFVQIIQQEMDRLRRYGGICSLAILDLDNFKAINDQFGHLAGDHVLQQVAVMSAASLRKVDRFFRYGGDEFLILMPLTGLMAASLAAERLRHELEQAVFEYQGQIIPLEASLGVMELDGRCASLEQVLRTVDRALYLAKTGGKNQVFTIQLETERKTPD